VGRKFRSFWQKQTGLSSRENLKSHQSSKF